MGEVLCKGDWLLGTACGRCQRCYDTAGPTIKDLRAETAQLRDRMLEVHLHISPGPAKLLDGSTADISKEIKAKIYDELRIILYTPIKN